MNTLAIVAFVLVFIIPIAGVVLAYIARSQIRRTREPGHGLMLAALIIGWVFILFQLIFLIAWGTFFVQAISHNA